jgi:hypothetical protein
LDCIGGVTTGSSVSGTASATAGETGTTLGIGAHVRGVVEADGLLSATAAFDVAGFIPVASFLLGYVEPFKDAEAVLLCLLSIILVSFNKKESSYSPYPIATMSLL